MEALHYIYTSMLSDRERLRVSWQETCEAWNDPVRRQFQREFQQPLEAEVVAAHQELEKLAHVMAQTRRRLERA